MHTPPSILCQIHARRPAEAEALAAVARICARDTGQPLALEVAPPKPTLREAVLTLNLPAELAASQHQIWCLSCRLACFCPDARVSVLVLGATSRAPDPAPSLCCA